MKYLIMLALCIFVSRSFAQSGIVFNVEQGPQLFHEAQSPSPYLLGLRAGYSHVWIRRSSMSSSWNLYSDFMGGVEITNPGSVVSIGIGFHKYLCNWWELDIPTYHTAGFYFFTEPGYMFHAWGRDRLGNSWYLANGIELSAGGVFLSVSVRTLFVDGTHVDKHAIFIPQIGAKFYTF